MQDNPGFYAPLQYNDQWIWAGCGLLLLVACWLGWVLWPNRRTTVAPAPAGVPPSGLPGLRERYLAGIDAVVADAGAGRIPERDAHQQLSILLRAFASEASGVDATRMTLQELHRNGLRPIAAGVAGMYPAEFGPGQQGAVAESAEAARQAVLAWN
ncbi:hypothetical protein [Arthrobacter sp. AZCC_0090]|uniref:hypothetical protein n=1 Tax=Arthrobacter sp. AZCC_0090 TaxID=2735881 RepID=UPI0016136EBB|nr:hypothetical protein [Arthrobacter sp. AZCC_0090]MBB6403222.1 hypothetical protein [Arthrobacter sp. AZCC_0090]